MDDLSKSQKDERPARDPSREDLKPILQALSGLQFGAVHITVQDGVIVQVERTEKFRLRRSTER